MKTPSKILSVFLSIILFVGMFTILPRNAFAFAFPGGDGSELDPYQIESCEQLQAINGIASDGYYFILNSNIDCGDTVNWNSGLGFMPLGYTYDIDNDIEHGDSFVGYFDGDGYTISNLYINRPTFENVGLFGDIASSTVVNVVLLNVNITGQEYVGGLIGHNLWSHIENTSTSGSVTGQDYVGGLVGQNDDSVDTIISSHSSAGVEGSSNVGGLVGTNQLSNIYS